MSTGPFTYTNRRGVPYYVHAVKTRQEHTRYTARRSLEGVVYVPLLGTEELFELI